MLTNDLARRSILIVEHEPLIALDIAALCEKAGARTMIAGSPKKAIDVVKADGLSAAVIECGSPNARTDDLCNELEERGIPFVLHCTCPNGELAFAGSIVVPKPAAPGELVNALVRAMNQHVEHSPAPRPWPRFAK
jgi:DNA-binding response OmpR family regulator